MTVEQLLYPPITPLRSGRLQVSERHELQWETCGHPDGIPALFLHGGPGGGCSPTSRRFFNPERYHLVLVDQRGAGRSTPLGEFEDNDTPSLIGDLERLREQLGLSQWLVFGGSWGSTLALAYAQAHPERCLGLILRGIWLGSAEEIDWWLHGMRQVFPEAWDAFAGFLPEAERGDLLAGYWRRLAHPSPAVHLPAARAWARYESACVHLLPTEADADNPDSDRVALGLGRLEAHYFRHQAFLAPGQLLANMPRIAHLPGRIVHGRYDMVCPVRYARALANHWPGVQLQIVPDAGHASLEPGIAAALVRATDQFAETGRLDG